MPDNMGTPEIQGPVWYNDISTIQKMMKDLDLNAVCPSCKMPFDKGKKRKLKDACGHERCYTCMCNSEQCVQCGKGSKKPNILTLRAASEPPSVPPPLTAVNSLSARPKLKTNGHFTTFMQARSDAVCHASQDIPTYDHIETVLRKTVNSTDSSPTPIRKKYQSPSPKQRHNLWPNRKIRSSSTNLEGHASVLSVLQWPVGVLRKIKSLWSLDDESPQPRKTPPPAADIARNDLYTRLGLLLGDRGRKNRYGPASQSSQESYASVSSLTSNDTNLGSASTSPLSTLTVSSEADNYSGAGISICSSQDRQSDSSASLMSVSTNNSRSSSPLSTVSRRHSVTTSAPGQIEDLFGKRKSSVRRSARAGIIKGPLDPRIRFAPYRSPQIHLKPQFFEVPQQEKEPLFIGRSWLFKDIEQELSNEDENHQGVLIVGAEGTGKTSTILQLVDHSCFGRKKEDAIYQELSNGRDTLHSSKKSLIRGSHSSLVPDTAKTLGSQVVAYHFCQADNNVTCLVPEFVHSIAAQLCQAPQLAAYRALLGVDTGLQDKLSLNECVRDPSKAFCEGIVKPLNSLKNAGKIPSSVCLIVVDSLSEAEYHRPEYGDSIASFLKSHLSLFPKWLKLVITVRTIYHEVVKMFSFRKINLDKIVSDERLHNDLLEYIMIRISSSPVIRHNVAVNGRTELEAIQNRFALHLLQLSQGNFLYLRMVLDLIEQGHLVMKSASFKVLPVTLCEVYMLHFNLKFPSLRSYEKIVMVLNVCLATLYPMTLLEIYHSVNAGCLKNFLPWEEFVQRMEVLNGFLIKRHDSSFMFFHPTFREWLLRREESERSNFLCDARQGHANISFRMSRLEAPLNADKSSELGHHILKAHIYKNSGPQFGFSSCDMQALWVSLSSADVSQALSSHRNLHCPNVKVSCLLLIAGADPNQRIEDNDMPLLALMAKKGFMDMVKLLVEFGADVNLIDSDGQTSLFHAAANGFTDIVQLLYTHGSQINHTSPSGYCPLTYAAINGHVGTVSFLLQHDWPPGSRYAVSFPIAAQQALVGAAANGKNQICEYMLNLPVVGIDTTDTLLTETAMTAASLNGHKDTCLFLLQKGANVSGAVSLNGICPLMSAVKGGHWEVADLLLLHNAEIDQSDYSGRTPLMVAAAEGHLGILELLLSKGASLTKVDKEGLTSLSWACKHGQLHAVQCLLEHGSNINHADRTGKTPLDLAATMGDPTLVRLLLDKGALVEHVDHQGMRPLDRAISCRNTDAISCFLRKGAKLGPATWTIAAGKPEVLLLLLSKLMEDGAILYKKSRINEAAHRYQYALKKFPTEGIEDNELTFQKLKLQLLLSLSRCKRKLNEHEAALELINKAFEINSRSFEAFYARARVRRDMKQLQLALEDLEVAMKIAPQNREIRRILNNIKEEIMLEETDTSNLLFFSPLNASMLDLDSKQEEMIL